MNNYEGDLYGRVGGKYFPTGYNSKQVDGIVEENKNLKAEVKKLSVNKWECNACADTENGYAPCYLKNELFPDEEPEYCPLSSDEIEWAKVK